MCCPSGGTVLPKYGESSALRRAARQRELRSSATPPMRRAKRIRAAKATHIRKDFVLGYDPSISYNGFMTKLRFASVAVLVCLVEGAAAAQIAGRQSNRHHRHPAGGAVAQHRRAQTAAGARVLRGLHAARLAHHADSGLVRRHRSQRRKPPAVRHRRSAGRRLSARQHASRSAATRARCRRGSCRSACRCPTTRSRFASRCGAPPTAATSRRARR